MLKFIKFIIVVCFVFSCKRNENNYLEWAIKMSDAVIHRFDSLMIYNYPSHEPRWQYDIAMLGQAIDKLGSISQKYSKYHEDYINYFVDDSGYIKTYKLEDYNLDHINPGKGLLILYKRTGDEKYLKAIDLLVQQLKNQPRTQSGGYWHKQIYPHQMWLDGIYMYAPFLAQYAKEFNQYQWFDTIVKQITLIYNKTRDKRTGLLYHGWDESKQQKWSNPETGCSPNFWGRSMGWFMMALVDVLEYFPEDHWGHDTLGKILNNTSEALMKVRDKKTKLWYQVLDKGDREGNYIEGSCSAMYTYAFAKGVRLGVLPKKYKRYAIQSFKGIVKNLIIIDKDGYPTMTNICSVAGLGGNPYRDGSYEYYINEKKKNNDPKGVAPFILAAIELSKLY